MIQMTDLEFHTMETYIRGRYGLNLEKKQYLIESKLWIELARCKADTYTEYWQMLRRDGTGAMERRMMDLLTTNYTYFCREEQHFAYLRKAVLPTLHTDGTFSVWCAGCATGQESYTLAMYLLDCRSAGLLHTPFSIVGSDLSSAAVETARRGEYGSADWARLSAAWQTCYCEPFQNGLFRVRDAVRQTVRFRCQNLLDPPAFRERYDLIFCRNVLIYFREQERAKLIRHLSDALVPGGYLFIGHTESLLGCKAELEYIQPAIYRKPEERRHGEK